MEIPKSILKDNEKRFATKSTKKERRAKLMKFADLATRRLGRPTSIVGICLKSKCLNRDKLCNECYRFSNLKEK